MTEDEGASWTPHCSSVLTQPGAAHPCGRLLLRVAKSAPRQPCPDCGDSALPVFLPLIAVLKAALLCPGHGHLSDGDFFKDKWGLCEAALEIIPYAKPQASGSKNGA